MSDINDKYKDWPDEVHPFKNYTMKGNPPKQPIANREIITPTTEAQANELLERASWAAIARLEKIVADSTSQPNAVIQAAKEILDRHRGKSTQAMTLDATVKQVIVNATIRFADEPQPVVIEHK